MKKAVVENATNRVVFLFPEETTVKLTEHGLVFPVRALDIKPETHTVYVLPEPEGDYINGTMTWTVENGWQVLYPEVLAQKAAADLAEAKVLKNAEINAARLAANRTTFTFQGKQIAVDELSRGDIDGVTAHVLLKGTYPPGFPGAWKAVDNTYVSLPDIAAWGDFIGAMATQGAVNFGRSEQRKGVLAAATTLAEVEAIVW
jgi:hypothetical protein